MAEENLITNYLAVYFGHTRYSEEDLVVDMGDDHLWTFAHHPVSSKNLRLLGLSGGIWRYVVNYRVEPLNGKLIIPAILPAYDEIHAWYYAYTDYELKVLTTGFKPVADAPVGEKDIFGQPHYMVHNFYPATTDFNIMITAEGQRALLTEAMFYGYYFILIDKFIPTAYARRAFEGVLLSPDQLSIYKGASSAIPTRLFVENFGKYEEDDNEITWNFWENT